MFPAIINPAPLTIFHTMAPRLRNTPAKKHRQQPGIGPLDATPIGKRSSSARRSLRSQRKPPVDHDLHASPEQSSPTSPASISKPSRTKRKRSQDFEAEAEGDKTRNERPAKQPRRSTRLEPSAENLQEAFEAEATADELEGMCLSEHPEGLPPLSEEDLRTLYEEVMDSAANNAPTLKRTSSRTSTALSETDTGRSQRSSSTTAFYRHKHLKAVKIHIHAEPPDYIEAAVNRIINVEVPKQRRAELRVIAQELRDGCLQNVRAQSGEDDFIRPLHTALKTLGLKKLCLHEKAAWREELKPTIRQQSHFSFSFMAGVHNLGVGDLLTPRKRQQTVAGEYMSPESSQNSVPTPPTANNPPESSMMPPPPRPALEKVGDRYPIKTPHPDLSLGADLTSLISMLSSQNLPKDKAGEFIDFLQDGMVQHEPDGPLQPMLILVPALRALDLAFPFAVVEGKAYSTGKQIFEAENQAAVSAACALKIQLDLDNLVRSGTTSPDAPPAEPPLFFSVTTQGPIHELWYHWTIDENGVRRFESKLLDSCNALLLERGEDFIVRLNNVVNWGTGPFVESVVERLRKVAAKAMIA